MIESLTQDQKDDLKRHAERWVRRAIRTDWDPEAAKKAARECYRVVGLSPPSTVLCFDSPLAAHRGHVEYTGDPKVVYPHDGAGWCYWRAFYSYFDTHFGLAEKLRPYFDLDASGAFWWWWYKEACFLCAPPTEFHFGTGKPDGSEPYTFHRDGGGAVVWSDGFALHYLHGVSVPRWLAETPAHDIDPAKFARIENVEIRREFIRKVGIERITTMLDCSILDTQGDYALLAVPLGGTTGRWPYLKMKNPSIGCYHLEAVAKECTTVSQALSWRNRSDKDPEVLT